MLIRLENGDWVDPRMVMSIRAIERPAIPEAVKGMLGEISHPPQIQISLQGGSYASQWFQSNEEAIDAADRIAAKINEALEPRP